MPHASKSSGGRGDSGFWDSLAVKLTHEFQLAKNLSSQNKTNKNPNNKTPTLHRFPPYNYFSVSSRFGFPLVSFYHQIQSYQTFFSVYYAQLKNNERTFTFTHAISMVRLDLK